MSKHFRIYRDLRTHNVFAKKRVWFFFWVTVMEFGGEHEEIAYRFDEQSMKDYLMSIYPPKKKKEKPFKISTIKYD